MNVGSFLYTGEVIIFTITCLKMIIFDDNVSSGQQFYCVSGDVEGDILKYIGSKHYNPILPLTPMCQDTPYRISYVCDNVCNFSELFYTFT